MRTETATVSIPELDLEIPATYKKSLLTTIEGFLKSICEDMKSGQNDRNVFIYLIY